MSERDRRSAIANRLFRIVGFVVSFASSAACVWMLSGALLELVDAPRRPLVVDIYREARKWKRSLQREERHERVALVGDSVLLAEWGVKSVPSSVREALRLRGGPRPNVQALGWPGLGVIAEYCLADEIVVADPDLIVLEFNLRGLHAGSLGPSGFPELAGHIRSERLLEAVTLPLSDAGITLDRLLFYRTLVAWGFEKTWIDLLDRQARLVNQHDRLEEWIEESTGSHALTVRKLSEGLVGYARQLVPGKNRATRARIEKNLWPVFEGVPPDAPRLRVLDATLRTFRRAGIPVLVWLAPANVEHMRYLGLHVDGLARTAESIRQVVEGAGARFVDLHWFLPDLAFLDSADHVTSGGLVDGSAVLGDRLALEITKAILAGDRRHEGPALP